MAVWFTLRSFYNVTGDFTLYPTEEALQNSSDSAQEADRKEKQVPNWVKSICGNCKKQESDFPIVYSSHVVNAEILQARSCIAAGEQCAPHDFDHHEELVYPSH
jgi:hypothetical protein